MSKSIILISIWSIVWFMFVEYCFEVLLKDWFGQMWRFEWWSIGPYLLAGFAWLGINFLIVGRYVQKT